MEISVETKTASENKCFTVSNQILPVAAIAVPNPNQVRLTKLHFPCDQVANQLQDISDQY
jgi:hypothetical protein